MKKRLGMRLLSLFLALVLCVQFLPEPALAYFAEQAGGLILTGADGREIVIDESWEETFPYGTFAFQNSEMKIEEGGETGVLQVYRLGGTTGRAVAYIQYVPSFAQISADEYTYANAAGYGDILIEVEDPLPIAAYQAIGKAPGPFAPAVPVGITVDAPETAETAEEGDYTLTVNTQADSYQWYVLGGGWEEEVSGAVDPTFVVSAEDYAAYDFYCVYTVDDVRYGSDSAKGAAYVPEAEEELEPAPEDLPLNPDPTYSTLEMDPENPYHGYLFPMTFADGEWVKEIRISAPQDDIAEPDKFGTFTIVDCDGASLYDAANTLALHVIDDEAPEPSQLGFTVTQAEFDKSAGTAELTVRRTGGKQNVVSVEYATEDGTAVGGRDYSPVSGTLVFYADIDEHTITIPLIDDGIESQERLTFQVRLSGVKGGGEADLCTLTEGMDTAQVSLYNTNTAQEANLATMLYDSEAIDLSAQVTEQSGSVAPVGAGTVTGEQEAEPEEALEAVIGYGPDDIVPYTFNYSQPIRFSRSSIGSYNGNYWKDYTQATDNGYNGWEADRFGFGSWSGDSVSNVDGGKRLSGDTTKRAYLSIPNLDHYYESIRARYRFRARLASSGSLFKYGLEYVYPWSDLHTYSTGTMVYKDASVTVKDGSWPNYKISYNTSGTMTAEWSMRNRGAGELRLGLSEYDAHGSDEDAYCHLEYAMLKRRTFSNNLNLTVYTANDADTVPNGAAQLSSYSGVYDSMRPKVTIVPREGGINSSGRLYVGSRLKIELANTASYFPARPESAGASYDYTVYLTNSSGSTVARATKGSGNEYYLTMDWGSLNEGGLSDQYTLNIVMTRKQNITINIGPSVDRQVDENGNTLTAIDTSKCIDAWNRFFGSATEEITIGRSSSSVKHPHFGDIQTEKPPSIVIPDKSQSFTWNDMENVQWINFHLSPEDRIVFNGRTYAGDEQIWLTMADLASRELVFYYYHKDFLTSEGLMVPTIDHIGLYLDGNGNGRIDGWYNRETGYFVLDESSGDEFITFLENGVDYDESYFEPVKINGQYRQFFLKAFYSKLPRCLVPQTGQEDRQAQILPAFVTNITDSSSYAELTEELQSYRYIIAGQNRAYANNGVSRSAGDYACSADGLPMYGGEASRMEVLDIPLGGDTSPAQMTEDKKGFTWTPNYRGNLLYAFPNPEPIFIAHSLAGDNIPIATITGVNNDGTIAYEADGAEKLNGYLGSFAGNSTVALCVQEQAQTTAQIAAANGGSAWPGVLGSGVSTFAARDGGSGAPNLEAVTLGEMGTFPNSQYLKQNNGQGPGQADIDMEDSGNELKEYNLDMGVKLPSSEIGVTDFATIIMDGYEVGFSIGMELGGFNSAGDAGAGGTGGGSGEGEWYDTAKALEKSKEAMGHMKHFLRHPSVASRDADDSYNAATKNPDNDPTLPPNTYNVKGFAVTFNVSMAFLFKYNPVDNKYYFSQFSVAAAAGLDLTYQHRCTWCPLIYLYFTCGASIEIATGATVERQTVTQALALPEGSGSIKKGQTISFPTQYKAFDIEFDGKLLVELYDEEGKTPVKAIGEDEFKLGFIKSDGDDPVTVTLLKKGGYQLDGGKTYRVVLTALEDTSVTSLEEVTKMETISYWNGFNISPEAFLQVGAGIGVEIMKFEVYIKASIGCSITLGSYDTDEGEYEGFSFDEFEFALAAGFQVVVLLFSYEMDMIGYKLTYDGENNEWIHSWV